MGDLTRDGAQRVVAALEDPRWTFRTVDGIARQAVMPAQDVLQVINETPGLARRSAMTDRHGSELYAAPERPVPLRERIERIRWMLAR
jgi:hypothetical protein